MPTDEQLITGASYYLPQFADSPMRDMIWRMIEDFGYTKELSLREKEFLLKFIEEAHRTMPNAPHLDVIYSIPWTLVRYKTGFYWEAPDRDRIPYTMSINRLMES